MMDYLKIYAQALNSNFMLRNPAKSTLTVQGLLFLDFINSSQFVPLLSNFAPFSIFDYCNIAILLHLFNADH